MGGGMPQRGGFGGGLQGSGSGMSRDNTAMGPYGGSGSRQSSSRSYTTADGGQFQSRSGSGSYTTSRGGTIDYGAAGASGTGPGGTTAGRGVYGVQGTTAGGRSYSDYGRVGGAVGPQGNAVGGRSSVGSVSGPRGTAYGGSRSVGGVGPDGAFGATERGGVAAGENGVYAAGGRSAVGYGPAGAVAGTSYGAVAARPRGTYYTSSSVLATQGTYARGAYGGAGYFAPGWSARYPSAWVASSYTMPVNSTAVGWGTLAGYCGYPQQPAYYDYGGNVVSQPDVMYVNGDPAGTPQQYAQQAAQLAAGGGSAPVDPSAAWQPIGIFGIAPPDPSPPNEYFQLAINRQGVLRGNYYNSRTDTTNPVSGSVDPKTLRAAWTIGDQKTPVFEAGIANLTRDETTMLVHDEGGAPQQVTLVRMPPQQAPDPPGDAPR
jgi:hypothetical protein